MFRIRGYEFSDSDVQTLQMYSQGVRASQDPPSVRGPWLARVLRRPAKLQAAMKRHSCGSEQNDLLPSALNLSDEAVVVRWIKNPC